MHKLVSQCVLLVVVAFLLTACAEQGEPKEITVRHILIMYQGSMRAPESVTRTREEAKALAEEILQMIKEGGDFAEFAAQYSDGPTKVRGGLLSPFGRGVMSQPFEDAAFALKRDEVSDVVETEFGFHIIKRE
ncbi:parvulin peptidyl-prolyl isomerase [candidate division KSB1 bacterium]|nr:peptidyl-prolyl cis-trans isomerase [candidate division KSB1 bacterium]RQW01281.1 MAG: parvulin peptidyl-prolyl isomerase [candidate division KSB1 bacterium]